MMQVYIMLES